MPFISFGQDFRINTSEATIENVDKFNRKGDAHANEDSSYYFYNLALHASERIGYKDGRIRAYKGLIRLHQNDEEVLGRLRYSLLLVFFLDREGTPNERGNAYYDLGEIYYNEELFEKASKILEQAARIEKIHPKLRNKILVTQVRARKNSGKAGDTNGQMDLEKIRKALNLVYELENLERLRLEEQIALYKEKAEICHLLGKYSEELGAYEKLLTIVSGTKYDYMGEVIWNNIGYANKYLGKINASQDAFMKVVNSDQKMDNNIVGGAFYNLGLSYQNKRLGDSAMYYFDQGMKFLKRARNWDQLAKSYNMEAMVYYQQDDQFNALKKVESAIALGKDHKLGKTLARSYEIQSDIHRDLYEYELALESYKRYLSVRDSVLSIERSRVQKRLFDQYKIEEYEKRQRVIWATNEFALIEREREAAEAIAKNERLRAKEKEDALKIAELANRELKAREELNELMLNEQKLRLKNQENELALVQRESELKELELERERLSASEKEKEIELLAQRNELQRQVQMRHEEEFNNKLRFVVSILFFFLLVLIGILIAYRQLRKRKKQIEEQNTIIALSKMEIEKEKEKSDGLLLNILPDSVAEELKVNGSSKPKLYDEVSVGFTDFSGFTMISEQLTPEELVEKLDAIFLEFDKIVENYGLQRIKTIGDAYMFASGLPVSIDDHAEKCVKAGIEMRDFIQSYNSGLAVDAPKWNIRIGINTGPVVAGVIGIKKFAYDIWGDTVNTASRMESSGEVNKVNISGSTFDHVKALFSTEYRGKVPAKNKGDIDMYFVEYK